jgi:predicted nucleotidyltransferase
MTSTSLDFSQKNDLRLLAALIGEVDAIADGISFLLAGAMARDLLLAHAHGVRIDRRTQDVDLAFSVSSWEEFERLRKKMLGGPFQEIPRSGIHKLNYRGTLEVDILPFGGVERADRTISLPPDNSFTMSVFGFREALASSVTVILPARISVQVVSLPALAILKLAAWSERHVQQPAKDAYDLRLIIRSYPDLAGERLFESNPYLYGSPPDYECAGAWLLGRDMAPLLDASGHRKLATLIAKETDEQGQLQLAGEMMRDDPERAVQLLHALEKGFLGEAIEQ